MSEELYFRFSQLLYQVMFFGGVKLNCMAKKVTVKTRGSPKAKRDLARKISRSLRKVVKVNLLNVLNKTIKEPLMTKIKHKDLIVLRKNKIKDEFHSASKPATANKENVNPSATNVRFIEFSSSESSPAKRSLRQQLLDFAKKHNPRPEMLDDIYDMMSNNGLQVYPSSDKGFFEKEKDFEVVKLKYGLYLNFGIERSIMKYYRPSFIRKPMALVTSSDDPLNSAQQAEIILLDVAVYIVKSTVCNGLTQPQCMIIFGRINCLVFDDPFVIGVYYGAFPTPTIGNEIMKHFVAEVESLKTREIVIGGNQPFLVRLNAVVCDPISNSLITCVSLPNSLFGCSKCSQKANLELDEGYTSFPTTMTLATLRCDDDFKYLIRNEHHMAQPLLAQLDLGLISQFVLDYKIIVCKGVMKHLVSLWMNGRLDYRINKVVQEKITQDLIDMTDSCPREFNRKPRSFEDYLLWDAAEWNLFLLYFSPIALKGRMEKAYYVHFLYLHLAMRIMMSSNHINSEANSFIMGQLLNNFIADFTALYGNEKVDYNVHNLLHFEQIQQRVGSLRKLNGFVYDQQIDMLNSYLEASDEVNLEVIGEKILDSTMMMKQNKINELVNTTYPHLNSRGELVFKEFTISTQMPDNHVMTKNAVVEIKAIHSGGANKEILIIGRRYQKADIMFQAPLSNQKLLLVQDLSPVFNFKASDIVCKAVRLEQRGAIFIQPLIT